MEASSSLLEAMSLHAAYREIPILREYKTQLSNLYTSILFCISYI